MNTSESSSTTLTVIGHRPAAAHSAWRCVRRVPANQHRPPVAGEAAHDHDVAFDALRGIAILAVMLSHVTSYWMATVRRPLPLPVLEQDALPLLQSTGWGVTLFFLLSGYLLTGTEERRARTGMYCLRSYALRRLLRLLPAYYVALVVAIAVWPERSSFTGVVLHLAFLQGWNPNPAMVLDPVHWSLTVEMAFYLLLPFLVLKLPHVAQRLALLAGLLLVSVGTWVVMHRIADQGPISSDATQVLRYLHFLPTTWLYLFLAGVLLRMLVEHSVAGVSVPRPVLASILFIASASCLVVVPLAVRAGVARVPLDLMVVVFFASALLGAPPLRRILSWRPLVFIGMISYSLFLLHHAVLDAVFRPVLEGARVIIVRQGNLALWAAFAVYAVAFLAVVVAAAYLSYRFVERPFLRLKPA